MDISVMLALRVGALLTPEAELFTDPERWRAALAANENLEGTLTIGVPEGEDIEVEDDVDATIQNLCLRGVPELVAGRPHRMPYFCCAGQMLLTPEGDLVRISGDFVPEEVWLPRLPLARGLHACAGRFISLLRLLGDPRHTELVARFDGDLQANERALAGAGAGG